MPKYNLSSTQLDELIEQFVELQVDNLDTKTMVAWISDLLTNDYDKLTFSELKERIDCYDEDLFDELVDNVTQQYPQQDVNNSTHTYSLNVNESITFPVHKK